ncbi:nucleoside hydrolase [Salinisphaera sp.]|uniref:nucleoside hydrolase n=1 Tax=Salinisphaera sp. TaxID=1914330 RepID=UPI002D78215B|nr:nucleoside hydrolase [Salinisphaera sp.]HET7314914.1 nucleoside hydrolase [Salinisphaera sp.]
MKRLLGLCAVGLALVVAAGPAMADSSQQQLVVIDQDTSGPGGSNIRSMLALIQSPQVKVLGIGVVTGNAWMKAETEHTLRMLELIGRRDIPVYKGAVHPLVRNRERTLAVQKFYGHIAWLGAWGGDGSNPSGFPTDPNARQKMPEGRPSISAREQDAAHFLIHAVHAHPGQVTVYAAGPLTDLALAQRIDPSFARTAKQLVVMGGSISPVTDNAEFTTSPSHEFNFWFDPEAAHIVLNAPWPKIIDTSVDISLQSKYTDKMQAAIAESDSPAAQYLAKYDTERYYMWDEIAALAWLHPDLVTRTRTLYLDTDMSHGPSYGDTLAWTQKSKPDAHEGPPAIVQMKLDRKAFDNTFIDLMRAPTPHATHPAIAGP